MCAVSMVHDFARIHIPQNAWTRSMLTEYKELVKSLQEVDDKLNLPDCDPNKYLFIKEIEAQIAEIESNLEKPKAAKIVKSAAKKKK